MNRALTLFLSLMALMALLAPAQAQVPEAPALAEDRARGAATITVPDMTRWLSTLASDDFGGRATGTEGFRKAADFVRGKFDSWGLKPMGDDGGYFQVVPWRGARPNSKGSTFTVVSNGKTVLDLDGTTGLGGQVGRSQQAAGPLTLVVVEDPRNHGVAELDLEGRLVLLALHPKAREGSNGRFASFMLPRIAGAAVRAGATGVIIVADGDFRTLYGSRRPQTGGRARQGRRAVPNAPQITADNAWLLLALANADKALLETSGRHDLAGLEGELRIEVESEQVPAWNVVGVVEGSDPLLKDEYVVIGSHLDHIGTRGTLVNNGADDDGSGSTAVMALARAFAKNDLRPRRSVLFVCFCGEENGLVGSRFFADNPPIELSSIVAELQMDMIGRNEESARTGEKPEDNLNSVHLVGTEKLSRDLHELCMKKNEAHGFELEFDEEGVFFRSDHASFARKGVPIAFFFTGFHPDYHRPTDTVDKINFKKLRRIALYVYDIAWDLAQADGRPLIDPELWDKNKTRLRATGEPAAPVRKR